MLVGSSLLALTLMLTVPFPKHSSEASKVSMAPTEEGVTARKRSVEAAVDSIAQRALQKYSIPGLTVAVIDKNEMILAKGYGFADLQQRVPARGDTIYQLGSISKRFRS